MRARAKMARLRMSPLRMKVVAPAGRRRVHLWRRSTSAASADRHKHNICKNMIYYTYANNQLSDECKSVRDPLADYAANLLYYN